MATTISADANATAVAVVIGASNPTIPSSSTVQSGSFYAISVSSTYSAGVGSADGTSATATGAEIAPHVTDTFYMSENIETAGSQYIITDFQVFDQIQFEITNTLFSSIQFSSALTHNIENLLSSSINLYNSINVVCTTQLAPKGIEFSNSFESLVSAELSSIAQFSTAFDLNPRASLSAELQLTDSITQTQTLTELLSSGGEFVSSFPSIGLAESLSNVVQFSDVQTVVGVKTETLSSTVQFSGVEIYQQTALETLTSVVEISHSIYSEGNILYYTVNNVVEFNNVVWVPDFNSLAWVVNTESGSLATYDNWNFQSMAYYDGVLYAVSPDGLFALEGNSDDGRNINAKWQTGFVDFGIEEKKRMSDIYVGYTGGDLECDIETYETDDSQVYTYTLEEREATAPRNNRIRVGKGLVSRRWRFTFRNINGADFQVHDMGAEVAMSRRRL